MMPASRSIRARTAQRNANEVGPPLLRKGKGAHDVFLPATVCSIMSKKVAQHRRSNFGRMCSSGPNLCYKRKKNACAGKGREDADHSDGSAVHTRTALIIMTLSFWISSYLLCMTNVFFTSKQPSCEMFFFEKPSCEMLTERVCTTDRNWVPRECQTLLQVSYADQVKEDASF
jgi:hypothetical protein